MKKLVISAFGVGLATVAIYAAPAFADRTVMVMLQEMPMTGTPPVSSYPVTVEVKMDPASMAAMKDHLVDGSMTLTCMPSGPQIMMCHGK
jgi:hypothetical protein